jgi:hypothetical protein
VNEHVVAPVDVQVPITVDWPVSPEKLPVPLVDVVLILTVEVLPLTVPVSKKVPNTFPPAKMSTKVPLSVNAVVLEKVTVPMFVAVK